MKTIFVSQTFTRVCLLAWLTFAGVAANVAFAQSATPNRAAAQPADGPFVVEYYYKTRWGFAEEFIRLFKKNHYPLLKKQVESGRMLSVTAAAPRYHGTEEGRWDYRVTITFKNVAAAHAGAGEEAALAKQMYPDQETFRREEQRRFELLEAHWDSPVVSVALDQ